LTVIFLLPTPISVMHATLAQTFFCIITSLALFTSADWKCDEQKIETSGHPWRLFLTTTIAIYVQLILGAWMRHSKAALAIPTFPLAFGHLIPQVTSPEIAIHFAHRVGAFVVFSLVCTTFVTVLRNYRSNKKLLTPSTILFCLVFVQIALGGLTVLSGTAVF